MTLISILIHLFTDYSFSEDTIFLLLFFVYFHNCYCFNAIYIYIYICIYICVCVCMYVCMYVYECVCVCVCVSALLRYVLNMSSYCSIYRAIGLMSRVFANDLGDRCSIPGRVIPKTQKLVVDTALFITQHYKVRVKWSNPGNGVVLSPTPQCSSYRKKSLRVTLDFTYSSISLLIDFNDISTHLGFFHL